VKAHSKSCSSVSFSTHLAHMVASVGGDELCKIWDVSSAEPKCVAQKDLKQGELFSVQFYADIPWVLAAGGNKGEVAIWDTEESETIKKHFQQNLDPNAPREPVVEDDGNSDFEDMSDDSGQEVWVS